MLAKASRRDPAELGAEPERALDSETYEGFPIRPLYTEADELAARTDIHVPDDGPYETLAGLVMTELGRIPVVGDVVELPHASLTVDAMDGRRVTRLHVRPKDPEAAPGSRGPEGERR